MNFDTHLRRLDDALSKFSCAPATLASDLVLLGLAADVADSARAASFIADSPLPHKAYPLARLAFDGAQNALVLATHEDYAIAGARAWAYFEWKNTPFRTRSTVQDDPESLTPVEAQWFRKETGKLATIWDSMAPGCGAVLLQQAEIILQEKRSRPDNWLGANMTRRMHRAYELVAESYGTAIAGDTASINRSLYVGMCRESHAHPRFESISFHHDLGTNRVHVAPYPRDFEQAKRVVMTCTGQSLWETTEALLWRSRAAV